MRIPFFSIVTMVLLSTDLCAQIPTVQVLESGKKTSIRGLSVVTDDIIWASGSNGIVAKSVDGGIHWNWMTIPGYEKRDFRDIEAFDSNTAIIMGIAEPAILLKTKDGGKSWKKVFEDTTKGMFLDAMDFADIQGRQMGIVIGDPIDHKLFYAFTIDGGDTWSRPDAETLRRDPDFTEGEAMFASSGTNVKLFKTPQPRQSPFLFVTGGTRSNLRYLNETTKDSLPLLQGLESTGANSLAIFPSTNKGVIVGGDFAKDSIGVGNCVLVSFTADGTLLTLPQTNPRGYRSGVTYITAEKLVACGTSGIDLSTDGGRNWQFLVKESFHVVQRAKTGTAVFLAGGGGRIAKLNGF